MKFSRKLIIEILAIAAVLAILGAVCFALFSQPTLRIRENGKWVVGKSKSEAVGRMGEPRWHYSYAEWERRERENVTKSYVPAPPRIDCEEVLTYTEMA